jgi:hypothetical protein
MQPAILLTTDQMEIALYNSVRHYHGFFEDVATDIGGRASALRQAMNPFYAERPSFITRTALVFIGWLRIHPTSGMEALQTFVKFIVQHAAEPDTESQLRLIEDHVADVRERVEKVQDAIDGFPQIRVDMRNVVRKRRTVKKLKQPSYL